jgi:hypothetical protein
MLSRKILKKLWLTIEPCVTFPKTVTCTDRDYSALYKPYVALELNKTWIYFIFDLDDSNINIFSHDTPSIDVLEAAVLVQKTLIACLFPSINKQCKVSKSE